jgi:DNA modification methylase
MSSDKARGALGISPLKVELRSTYTFKPAKRNARTHGDKQIEQIAASLKQFGFLVPVLVNEEGRIVAGHGRVEAAKRLGLEEVPVIPVAHLTEDELRAYALADNKLAANAGWDDDILRVELKELQSLDLAFDIEITGFGTTEIDVLIDGKRSKAEGDLIPTLDPRSVPAVVEGNIWLLGGHRLICGNSLEPGTFHALMQDERARMVFSDPPYNVAIDGHVCGLGATRHAEFQMASGEMSRAQFTRFLKTVFANAIEVSIDGAIHYQCMDWRHIGEMLEAGEAVYSELKNVCVWAKDNGGMGTFYRSRHELVFVWKSGCEPHLNTVELGRNGRYRTNVWEYPAATKTGEDADLKMHPTVKPVPMIIDAIKDTSKRGEIVLDPFGGSGSTLIAAEKAKRRARLIELEPGYCEVTIRRWQDLTGEEAVLEATGESFSSVAQRRAEDLERACDRALEEAV